MHVVVSTDVSLKAPAKSEREQGAGGFIRASWAILDGEPVTNPPSAGDRAYVSARLTPAQSAALAAILDGTDTVTPVLPAEGGTGYAFVLPDGGERGRPRTDEPIGGILAQRAAEHAERAATAEQPAEPVKGKGK